jgi:RNAse (barnase) inhibitor barstar
MTNKQEVIKEAKVKETSQTESENVDTRKGDYTKYFYRNIDRLWDAVMQLQEENSRLKQQMKNASVVLNGGN